MTPPSILRYNASSVPILQMSISSDTMSESSLYDYGYNFIRTQMATVQGASFPLPYGGRPRQIMVDIDLKSLYAQGLSANDVVNAVNAQSLIIPSGIAKIGPNEFVVRLNSLPPSADAFNSLPIKTDQRNHSLPARHRPRARWRTPSNRISCATTETAPRC